MWLKDYEKDVGSENLQVYRFKRIAFGVISSPLLLGAVIQHHLNQILENPLSSEEVKYYAFCCESSLYVDNY